MLGFVGNTGDAEPTPPHLHFEVHPGGEEADAVDPYRILTAWQGRRDVAGRRVAAARRRRHDAAAGRARRGARLHRRMSEQPDRPRSRWADKLDERRERHRSAAALYRIGCVTVAGVLVTLAGLRDAAHCRARRSW